MRTLTDAEAARALAEIEFQETEWEGCSHLDCFPGCSHNLDNWRCERFELAFAMWAANRPDPPSPIGSERP